MFPWIVEPRSIDQLNVIQRSLRLGMFGVERQDVLERILSIFCLANQGLNTTEAEEDRGVVWEEACCFFYVGKRSG